MSDKPFKTVEEQIELLKSRGVCFDDEEAAMSFLLSENYYSVINGYKEPFLDCNKTKEEGDDRYIQGLPFIAFRLLYLFDEGLRQASMRALLKAETRMRTATVYAFCDVHRGAEDYLDPLCYCSKDEYGEKNYTKNLIRLLSGLQAVRDNKYRKSYVGHYVSNHGCLPLWVAAQSLSFGNMSAFFSLQKQNVQGKTCAALCRVTGRRYIKQSELKWVYRVLPVFRNTCAHNERFYCFEGGKKKELRFRDMFSCLEVVLTAEEISDFAKQVVDLLKVLEGTDDFPLLEHVQKKMKVSIDDLEEKISE